MIRINAETNKPEKVTPEEAQANPDKWLLEPTGTKNKPIAKPTGTKK